jgi:hypothetical protein
MASYCLLLEAILVAHRYGYFLLLFVVRCLPLWLLLANMLVAYDLRLWLFLTAYRCDYWLLLNAMLVGCSEHFGYCLSLATIIVYWIFRTTICIILLLIPYHCNYFLLHTTIAVYHRCDCFLSLIIAHPRTGQEGPGDGGLEV